MRNYWVLTAVPLFAMLTIRPTASAGSTAKAPQREVIKYCAPTESMEDTDAIDYQWTAADCLGRITHANLPASWEEGNKAFEGIKWGKDGDWWKRRCSDDRARCKEIGENNPRRKSESHIMPSLNAHRLLPAALEHGAVYAVAKLGTHVSKGDDVRYNMHVPNDAESANVKGFLMLWIVDRQAPHGARWQLNKYTKNPDSVTIVSDGTLGMCNHARRNWDSHYANFDSCPTQQLLWEEIAKSDDPIVTNADYSEAKRRLLKNPTTKLKAAWARESDIDGPGWVSCALGCCLMNRRLQ